MVRASKPPRAKSRAGRPRREPQAGERVQLSLRVTPQMKRRLDTAADQSGRSQSQEVEFRLERSFEREEMLSEVLTVAYGEQTAAILMTLGMVIEDTKFLAQHSSLHTRDGHAVLKAEQVNESDLPSYTLDQGIKAAMEILEEMLPPDAPKTDNRHASYFADLMLHAIRRSGSDENLFRLPVSGIRPMLGKIAEQIKNAPPIEKFTSRRPFELALAVLNANSALEHSPRTRSADDVAKILERYLKDFLPHDWRRRGRNRATVPIEAQREPEAEFQRRVESIVIN
jgi:hypothetical protein